MGLLEKAGGSLNKGLLAKALEANARNSRPGGLLQKASNVKQNSGLLNKASNIRASNPGSDSNSGLLAKASQVNSGLLNRATKYHIQGRDAYPDAKCTEHMSYDPDKKLLTVKFQNGHVHEYPNVSRELSNVIREGTTTKEGRTGSIGAALWKTGLVSKGKGKKKK